MCMFVVSLVQMIAKSFSIALLALTNPNLLVAWLVGDMGLLMLYKLARRDFVYFIPLKGVVKWVVSIFMRVAVKALADFNCLFLLRGPFGELK